MLLFSSEQWRGPACVLMEVWCRKGRGCWGECVRGCGRWRSGGLTGRAGVRTAGNASFRQSGDAVGEGGGDGEIYVPARVRNGRAALRDAPVRDVSGYTFVDLGSGKGRMLFVAAERPFRRVIGVEFSRSLHAEAEREHPAVSGAVEGAD